MRYKRRYRQRRKPLDTKPVAARLRQVRRHFGYSQDEMAAVLGITKDTYGKNERGYHLPSTESLAAIYDKLGINIEWLLFNRDAMSWKEPGNRQGVHEDIPGELPFFAEATEMVDLMKRIPFLRHAVLGFFQRFKIENERLIRRFLEKEAETGATG